MYSYISTTASDAGTVVPDNIVDEFTATLEADPDNEQRPEFLRNRGYDSNSGRFWNLRNCDWYIRAPMNGVADDSPSSASATRSGAGSRGPNAVRIIPFADIPFFRSRGIGGR